jgi:MFS family permease
VSVLAGIRARSRVFPGSFWLLVTGTFIYHAGYNLGYPYETLYLHGQLHITMTTVGLMIGLPMFIGLPVLVAGGAIADRYGRRPVLCLGICASATLYGGLALTGSLALLVVLITFEAGCGWAMFMTANNAIIADLTPLRRRAEAYSLSRVAVSVGMVVGPLSASLLLGAGLAYRPLFALGGAVMLLFLLLVLIWLPETRPAAALDADEPLSTWAGYRAVFADRRFLAFCALTLLPLYGFGQLWVTFPVAVHGLLGVPAASWGLLVTLYALSGALLQYPVVRRLRGAHRRRLMAAASALIALGMGGVVFAAPGWSIVVLVLLIGLGVVLLVPISSTIVAEMAPQRLRGRYMGAWTLVWMGGLALGSTLGGLAMDDLGARGAYMLILATGLLGSLLFALQKAKPAVTAALPPHP